MKKYVKADSYMVRSGDNGKMTDIIMKLQEVQTLCSDLEDFYWGNQIAEEFTKCYNYTTKAIACVDRANAKMDMQK